MNIPRNGLFYGLLRCSSVNAVEHRLIHRSGSRTGITVNGTILCRTVRTEIKGCAYLCLRFSHVICISSSSVGIYLGINDFYRGDCIICLSGICLAKSDSRRITSLTSIHPISIYSCIIYFNRSTGGVSTTTDSRRNYSIIHIEIACCIKSNFIDTNISTVYTI